MFKVTVTVPPLIDKFEALARAGYEQALKDAGDYLITSIRKEFQRQNSIATEKTVNSIKRSGVHAVGDRLVLEVSPTGNRRRAMEAIELGRRKNKPQPPLKAILEWMEARGIADGEPEYRKKSIAYAIAKTIGDRGIPAKHIFQSVATNEISYLQDLFQRATDKIVTQFNASRNG
jgi:predicted KAP-like P-loop ATPase